MQSPYTGHLILFENLTDLERVQREWMGEHPGEDPPPIFTIGEVVEIKGGRFRIAAFGRKFMRLESLPRLKGDGQ